MARRIKFSVEEYYHIYNRGTDKRIIFEDEADYERFLGLLYACNKHASFTVRDISDSPGGLASGRILEKLLGLECRVPVVAIGAYVLMPNHFHILIKEIKGGGISKFMHDLSTAFTMYFNEKNQRKGGLFEGTFKARHVDFDQYLKYIFSYIHLNPVKLIEPKWKEGGIRVLSKAKEFLSTYPYSSYFDYQGQNRECAKILDRDQFPDYFSSTVDCNKHINDWLLFKDQYNFPEK